MLTLFKGELSMTEFYRGMPYKEMLALRDARVKQLLEEKKSMDDMAKQQQQDRIRTSILAK